MNQGGPVVAAVMGMYVTVCQDHKPVHLPHSFPPSRYHEFLILTNVFRIQDEPKYISGKKLQLLAILIKF